MLELLGLVPVLLTLLVLADLLSKKVVCSVSYLSQETIGKLATALYILLWIPIYLFASWLLSIFTQR